MSEIKEYTGIEKNGIVLYRLNEKLGPEGLVETRKVDQGDGNLGVTVASLTENGKRAVGRVLDDDDNGPTLAEQVKILRSEVENLSEKVDMYEGVVEETNDHMAEARETASRLEDALDRIEAAEEQAERLDELRETLEERIEKEVESAVKSRHFVGVDLAAMLHDAGIIGAPQTEEHLVNDWNALGGYTIAPSPGSRVVEPGPRLPDLADGGSVSGTVEAGGAEAGEGEAIVSREAAEKLERLEELGGLDQLLDQLTEEGSA